MSEAFDITFWGVRGTMPTPGQSTLAYGGHTSCVQMRCGDARLIFDAGSGLFPLGEDETLLDADLFLSHTHIDHILGLGFFSPAFRAGASIRLWAGHLRESGLALREVLERVFSPPIFPLTLEDFKAELSFTDFAAGEDVPAPHLAAKGIQIKTMPLNHPDCATGYRVEYKGRSACYITDVEHLKGGLDTQLIDFISDADLLIYDCTFDDRDFERFVGWGHSTWQQAARLCDAAGVKQLAVYHHDPARSDEALDAIKAELNKRRAKDVIAQEGLSIQLLKHP